LSMPRALEVAEAYSSSMVKCFVTGVLIVRQILLGQYLASCLSSWA
jgi:hypothetical protein